MRVKTDALSARALHHCVFKALTATPPLSSRPQRPSPWKLSNGESLFEPSYTNIWRLVWLVQHRAPDFRSGPFNKDDLATQFLKSFVIFKLGSEVDVPGELLA